MVRFAKKSQFDAMEDLKQHRFQRKGRGHKFAAVTGMSKQDRRHGWGYAKRRSVLIEE